MERSAFVRFLEFAARDGTAAAMLRALASAEDSAEGDGMGALGRWYRSLDDRERALVAELAYRTADLSTHRLLRVLDGAYEWTAEEDGHALELLQQAPLGPPSLAGPQHPVGLHALMGATTSTRADAEPTHHSPIPDLPRDRPFRFLPAEDDALLELVLSYYRAKPELRAIFPDPDSLEFWRWVNVDAYAAYAEFRELLPPVPPAELRDVVSSGGLIGFLDAGFAALTALSRALGAHGVSFDTAHRVLDFGCGCGRVLRLLSPHARHAELQGCDVDARAVAWCRRELEFANAEVSAPTPPLSFAAGTFDLVYSISVFSHLEERNHLLWIAELARVTAPDGLVVVTTHGPGALEQLAGDAQKCAGVGLTPAQVELARHDLDREGFAFCRQEQLAHAAELYGMTFLSRDYVERRWSAHFEILGHEDRGLQGWQDLVVMRPRRG